jgi:hypothetical protein
MLMNIRCVMLDGVLFGTLMMLIVRSFAGCIHVKPFSIMSEFDISLNKLPAMLNTLILVFVGSSRMLVTLPDAGRHCR